MTEIDNTPSNKRGWVWTHFNSLPCGKKLQFTVASKSGTECGALLSREPRSSTKGMADHLITKHKLEDPKKIFK